MISIIYMCARRQNWPQFESKTHRVEDDIWEPQFLHSHLKSEEHISKLSCTKTVEGLKHWSHWRILPFIMSPVDISLAEFSIWLGKSFLHIVTCSYFHCWVFYSAGECILPIVSCCYFHCRVFYLVGEVIFSHCHM